MRIARVDNISAAAYRLVRPGFSVHWVDGAPARMADAMARGMCDAALVPVAELPRLAHAVSPAGPYGIAANGPVRSVLYVGRRMPGETVVRGEAVYVSPQSRTARALFPVLCRISYGLAPRITTDPAAATARVVIGNEALRLSRTVSSEEVVIDLPEWWRFETNLPFVFAQWVVRRTLPPGQKRAFRDWLERSAACAGTPEGRGAMAHEVRELGFGHDEAVEYYRGIQYALTEEHRLGMAAFLNLQEEATPWAVTA